MQVIENIQENASGKIIQMEDIITTLEEEV